MSFILDALKKSEAERQRQAGPALLEMRITRPTRRLPLWALVVGLLLILNVAVLGWLAWRSMTSPETAAVTAVRPAASAPATTAPGGVVSTTTTPGTPVPLSAPPALTAPVPTTSAAPEPQPADADADSNPADVEPAVAPMAGASANDTNGLRNYAELSGNLPELRLDLHVYAANARERYAFINMHKVHEGDVTPEGVEVKEITRDGVVLDYHGTEFVLGRQ